MNNVITPELFGLALALGEADDAAWPGAFPERRLREAVTYEAFCEQARAGLPELDAWTLSLPELEG